MLNQFAAEIPTLPVDQSHSHFIRYQKDCWDLPSYRRAAKKGPPCIWDTHGISGNIFSNPHASSSAPYPQELNLWVTTIEEPLHMSTVEKSERPKQNWDLRCQSGPSAKDSVIFSGGDSSKNYWADQQRLQILEFHFDKFRTPATFACWEDKVQDRGMFSFAISYGKNAMDQRSGDGWFSGWFKIFVIFSGVFQCRIWSTWWEDCVSTEPNHQQFSLQRKNQSGEKKRPRSRDRFLRGRQIANLIFDYSRVTGVHDSVENYADLFTIVLRNDDIQEFDSKWDGIFVVHNENPTWWYLGRIVQIKKTSLRNLRPYWNCMTWKFIRRS